MWFLCGPFLFGDKKKNCKCLGPCFEHLCVYLVVFIAVPNGAYSVNDDKILAVVGIDRKTTARTATSERETETDGEIDEYVLDK